MAALVLGQPPTGREREARVALAALVKDAEPDVRFAAMASLGRVGDETSMPEIVAGIDDSDGSVREAAVIAVGRIGGPGAHAALRRAAGSEHGEVRFQAPPALVELCGEDARPDVVVLLGDERPTVRANAVRALKDLPPHPPTVTRMTRLLNDEDAEVRLEAALVLAEWDEPRAAAVLRAAIEQPRLSDELMFAVLDGVGKLKDRDAVEPLHRLATAVLRARPVKAAAAAALARIGDPRGAPLLRGFLTGFRGDLRDYVLGVVGALSLTALENDVMALLERPRGVDAASLAAALEGLAPESERARRAVEQALVSESDVGRAIRARRAERRSAES